MNLLLDQGLPRTAAALLREMGIDAVHVGEIGMAAATDEAILARGAQEQRAIVTLDADFHALLVLSGADQPSVIRLRIEGLKAVALSRLVQKILGECAQEVESGALITVQENRIRVRGLPLLEQ